MASIDLDGFRRDGYTVVRNLFSAEEAEDFRNSTIELVEGLDREGACASQGTGEHVVRWPKGDMLTYEPLRRILLDPRLVGAVREVLGDDPAFWGESVVKVGDNPDGTRAWHTDAYETPVTRGLGYPLVRCGLYFQDTVRHSDGLALVAGSHLREDEFSLSLRNKVRTRARPWVGAPKTRLLESEPGDLAIWDMRILHAGEVVRFKPAPSLPLPLAWQGYLPASLRLPLERTRVVMFPTFGLPGPDLDSWLDSRRPLDWMQEIWDASHFPDSVVDEAAAAGLRVIRPVPSYGRDVKPSAEQAS